MEKAETQYREAESRKQLTIDFSSELARHMKLGTVPRREPQISELVVSRSEDHQGSSNSSNQRSAKVRKIGVSLPFLRIRPERIFRKPRISRVSAPSYAFSTKNTPLISNIAYALKEISKIPRESLSVLDEFSYLPVWLTMPIIFATSVVIGAALSVFMGL
jgi:hypothetical protein